MTAKETPLGSQPVTFDRPKVLLVEGPDDRAFASMQLNLLNISNEWQVHFMTGNSTDWVGLLEVIQLSDYFQDYGKSIGIILDSDNDPRAAADKARGYLTRARLTVPEEPGEVSTAAVKTGYFLMPSAERQGALEELILDAIDPGRVELATSYIKEVSDAFAAPKKISKAVVQAYLAGQRDHVKSLPVAVQKDAVVPRHAEAFNSFRAFLLALN